MSHQPFWECGMLPVLCYGERNYFYSVSAEETSSPGTDFAYCISHFIILKSAKALLQICGCFVGGEKSGFLPGVFSTYLPFFCWACE